jgi:2-oxoisovalerate dehydrogenase E1 component alpha subunit
MFATPSSLGARRPAAFAGVHNLPVVFVATNNQWAISVPLRLQTCCETLAQKAIAAGFTGEQVDGSDVLATRAAADEAITAARDGKGPRFIEAVLDTLGIKLESVYYTQGHYDFVDIVDARYPEAVLAFSVWYSTHGLGRIQSMPAFEAKTFEAAIKDAAD